MKPLRNTILSIVVTGSRVVAVALGMVLLARSLGPRGFGEFTYALTVASVLAVIPDYGFDLQIVKRVAGAIGDAYLTWRSAVRAKALLTICAVVLAVVWFGSQRLHGSELMVGVVLFASAIALSYGRLNTFIFRAVDRFDLDATTAIVLNSVLIAGILVAINTDPGPVAASFAFLLARVAFLALTMWMLIQVIVPIGSDPGWPAARSLLRDGLPYGIHTAVAVMYVSTDTLVLRHYAGMTSVGIYQAGVRLVLAAMFLPEVLTSGLFPSFSAALARGARTEALELGRVMSRLMVLGGGIIAAVLALVPDTIRQGAFSSQYVDLDLLLPWFGLIILFRFVSATYGAVATAAGGQRTRTWVGILALAINISANLILIPRLGLVGAIIASVMTHALLTVGYAILCHHLIGAWLLDRRTVVCATVVLAATIMALTTVRPEQTEMRIVMVGLIAVVAAVLGTRASEWRRIVADLAPTAAVDEDHS